MNTTKSRGMSATTPSKPEDILPNHSMRFLNEKGITFERYLGGGTFGQVWLVRQQCVKQKEDFKIGLDRPLVCKVLVMKKESKEPTKETVVSATLEADKYLKLNHLNVIKRTDVFIACGTKDGFPQPPHVLVFMGLMEGNLRRLFQSGIDNNESNECMANPEKFTHIWSKQIVNGLKYLHEYNISHLDIKPENILYITHMEEKEKKYTFKLTDFGQRFRFVPKQTTVSGKPAFSVYSPNEAMASFRNIDSERADIYSLGVTMAESVGAGVWPLNELLTKVREMGQSFATDLKVDRCCLDLISKMIQKDLSHRPDIISVYSHVWIKHFFPEN